MNNNQPSLATTATKGDILIVDDTLPNLRLLSTMLTENGYEVRGVPNGTMALTAVRSAPPDLILLDINMPKLDGYEVCRQLKADSETQGIPIIFISALDEVIDKVKAFSVGGVDYVTKPFQVAEILVRIENHLTIRRLQHQLQQTNAELSQTNAELQTTNAELRATNAALKATNQELDAFARTVAQDLKNPLTLITGQADRLKDELAQGDSFGAACRELLDQIEAGGQRSSRVIDSLLLLAWVRKGQVEQEVVAMGGIIEQAIENLTPLVNELEADLILPEQWPTVMGYGPWLEEVWTQYISNGLLYGGQPLRLEIGATPQVDGTIRFWVRDNGPGIAPEAQTKLFTEFTQLDEAEGERGLGLSIVRRIIERLGGTVGVESRVGQGSTFYFILPSAGGDNEFR